jgi:ABC-type transport system substrate-binding protein
MISTAHVSTAPWRRHREGRTRWVALAVALLVAVTTILWAQTSPARAAAVDTTGVVRVATTLEPLGPLHFDPATSVVNADVTWEEMIFGTLLRWNPKGGLDPWMAESVKVVDPLTVTMTLRKGLTFTDGTPYDAEAVRTGLLHTMHDASAASVASRHAGFKFLQDVTVDSPTQVTMHLNAPGASDFLESMAHREGAIVDPKQIGTGEIDTHPIGAGPFEFAAYTPAQTLTLKKNKDFFDTKHWKLGGIQYVNTPAGPAATTGLLADAFDIAPVQVADVAQVKADGRFEIVSGSTDYGYVVMQMCPNKPPFDNPEVRKAVQLAFDRKAIIQLAYQGQALPAYGLWPTNNVNFNPATEKINTYNPKKAKQILAKAGVKDATFEMHYVTATNYGPLTEVLQSQLKAIGITATIVPDADILNAFIAPQKPGAQVIPGSRRNVDKYNRLFAPGTISVLCGVARPDIMDTVAPTAGMALNDPARAAAFKKAELMAAQNANPIPLVFTVSNYAIATKKVAGPVAFSQATGNLLLDNVYVKKKT